MATFDDLEDIAPTSLDATTTDLLLAGAVERDDAPPGFDLVAGLITRAQGPATAEELAARDTTVTRFAEKVRARPVLRTKRALAFPKFAAKVLALAAPVVLLAGGVVAATGSLPPSAQAAVSGALSNLGISVPKPPSAGHAVAVSPPSTTASAVASGTGLDADPDAGSSSQATVGLCRAWKAGRLSYHSTAYRNLVAAAGGAGLLSAHCADVPTPAAPDAAPRHAQKPPSGQLEGEHAVTKASTINRSTINRQKTAAQVLRSLRQAIALRHSGAVTAAKATSTTRLPGGSSGHPPVSTGVVVPRGTRHGTTATTGSRRHHSGTKASTKAGKREAQASTSSTHGKARTTSAVKSGSLGRARQCTDAALPSHVTRGHHDCHPVAPTGSKSIAGPSVSSKARSVRHHKGM